MRQIVSDTGHVAKPARQPAWQPRTGVTRVAATIPSATSPIDWSSSTVIGRRSPIAREFADSVVEHLVGNLLPYSARQDLIRQATDKGITRFEANLIIAAVQHHLRISPIAPPLRAKPASQVLTPIATSPRPRRRLGRFFTLLATFFAVEAAVVMVIWLLF